MSNHICFVLATVTHSFDSIFAGCPEGCLEVHFLDNSPPYVLRQPSGFCEFPNILTMDCVFHAEKHWRIYTGDSSGSINCWTATVIASMCDSYAFFQSLRKSKAMGMIGSLSDAIIGGTLSSSYKFTSILDVEETKNILSQNGCKISCMVMNDRRDFLIAGDSVGVLRMFTNTMEEMWSSTKHKCAVRSLAISSANDSFASGDVSVELLSILKQISCFSQAHGRFLIWNLVKKIILLDIETDPSIPIIGMQFLIPYCPALVTCSLEGKFRVWALHTPLVAPQRAKHDENIDFSKQVDFETVVGNLFVPDAAISILYGANQKTIDQNIASARTVLIQIPESKRCVCILEPHGHRLHCISQISSNGYFATCGAGDQVLLWNASLIACVKTFSMSVTESNFCAVELCHVTTH